MAYKLDQRTMPLLAGAAVIALAGGGAGYLLRGDTAQTGNATHAEEEESGGDADEATVSAGASEGTIAVSDAQIQAAGIAVAVVQEGLAGGEVTAAGVLVPPTQSVGHVTARTSGVVVRILRQLGDRVGVGDPLAVIDGREVAEAQGAAARARRAAEAARTVLVREESLFRQRVTARQDYEAAQAAYDAARIEAQQADQALRALGAGSGGGTTRLMTLRSPVAGEVTSVTVTPGEYVPPERELFQVADPRTVWAELMIPARDIQRVVIGQTITLSVQGSDHPHTGRIRFLSPAVDPATGAAKAIATIDNTDGDLRVGQNVSARVATPGVDGARVPVVPRSAIQETEGRSVVFVRTQRGFVMRPVTIGLGSDAAVPVLSGLRVGERVATVNAFVLKAELGKAEAEHDH
jgi:cobalt-zinc-cadmium efflux system membrane fusion protein